MKHFHDDEALTQVLGIKQIPKASALGNWLRRMGNTSQGMRSLIDVNRRVLKTALHHRKGITLDIDATEIISQKADAKWTYKKNQGYMPMVGHIAEVGMVVACDFRSGNISPAKENLEFIKQCQSALPQECHIASLRIEALEDKDWQSLIHKKGETSQSQSICRTVHWISDNETPRVNLGLTNNLIIRNNDSIRPNYQASGIVTLSHSHGLF